MKHYIAKLISYVKHIEIPYKKLQHIEFVHENIEKFLKKFKRQIQLPEKKEFNQEDYEFMESLSGAILEKHPKKLHFILKFWALTLFIFIIWAGLSQVDEVARGVGDVIPSNENQIVQNLEGGIVESIEVQEGTHVKKGTVLLKINNEKSFSTFESNEVKAMSLEAKILRLTAEAQGEIFDASQHDNKAMIPYIQNEQSLYQTNLKQLHSDLEILNEQLLQKRNDLEDAKSKKIYLSKSLAMVRKEINMTEPMVERGVASQVDLLRLQKEENQSMDELKSAEFAIIRYESEIKEILHKIDSAKFSFQSKAKEKLTETLLEYKRTVSNSKALQDQVTRTVVKAPRDGIIQKLFVNTIGGVVKPGDNLVEIVPSNEKLLVNAKISPADIAFIYPSQKAIVKFSAYDFSIFGGMEAKVVSISPDTIKDKDEKTYYIVRIETQNDTLKHSNKTMKIIPGMTAQVDILTGKKSILSYILKPILKTKQYAFGDR